MKEAGALRETDWRGGQVIVQCSVQTYQNDIYEANISFQFGERRHPHSFIIQYRVRRGEGSERRLWKC